MNNDNVILTAVVGSKAYNLDTENSDTDLKGIYVAPTSDILTFAKVKEVIDHSGPDYEEDIVYYEVGKWFELALKANPTVLELAFLTNYEYLSDIGKLIVDNRHIFLSNKIKKTYVGYALSQARKLVARSGTYSSALSKRTEKNTRHIMRLIIQAKELLSTGDLHPRLTDEQREEVFAFGKLANDEANLPKILEYFTEQFKIVDEMESVLPDEPNLEAVNELLLSIRKKYL